MLAHAASRPCLRRSWLGMGVVVCGFAGDFADVSTASGVSRIAALDAARAKCATSSAHNAEPPPPPPPPPAACACEHVVFSGTTPPAWTGGGTGHAELLNPPTVFFEGITFTRLHEAGTAGIASPVYRARFLAQSGAAPGTYYLYHASSFTTASSGAVSAWVVGTDYTSTSSYVAYATTSGSAGCPLASSGLTGWKQLAPSTQGPPSDIDLPALVTRCTCQCEQVAVGSSDSQFIEDSPLPVTAQVTYVHEETLDPAASTYLPWVYRSDGGLYLRRTSGGVWVISPTVDGTSDWLARDDGGASPFCPEHVHQWAVYSSQSSSWLTPANSGGINSQCTCCDAIILSAVNLASGERLYRQRASVSLHGRPVYHDGVFGYYLM